MGRDGKGLPVDGATGAGRRRSVSPPSSPGVRPAGWEDVPALRCGFGERRTGVAGLAGLVTARQVHGSRIVDVEGLDPAGGDRVEADGLLATRPGSLVGVRTAGCVPILLVAADGDWAAAVHAGWRGTLAGIAGEAVSVARRAGVDPSRLRAALGPSVGPCCYEVSTEVAERFEARGLPVGTKSGSPRLDLRAINERVLLAAGLFREAIQRCGPCTCCHHHRYHSYRMDPSDEGRQLSWIGWEVRAPRRGP